MGVYQGGLGVYDRSFRTLMELALDGLTYNDFQKLFARYGKEGITLQSGSDDNGDLISVEISNGNGNFSGNLTVGGTINAGTINANVPSATPASHANDKSNPHGVTVEQIGAAPASHASDKNNPHGVTAEQVGAAPAGYGFGANTMPTVQNTTEANAMSVNSFASFRPGIIDSTKGFWGLNILENGGSYGSQLAYSIGGLEARREKSGGTWQSWEWVNPPMITGAEYRTTRRINGNPVYVKRIDMGTTPSAGSSKTVSVGSSLTIIGITGYGKSSDSLVTRVLPAYTNEGLLAYTVRGTSETSITLTSHDGASKFTNAYNVMVVVEYIKY